MFAMVNSERIDDLLVIEYREEKSHLLTQGCRATWTGHARVRIRGRRGVPARVEIGKEFLAGPLPTKVGRESYNTWEITGRVPRVTKQSPVRHPEDPFTASDTNGLVRVGESMRDKRRTREDS